MDKSISFTTEGRRSPRIRNKHATTHFGEVYDLSAGGMKVFRKHTDVIEIGAEFEVELQCEQHKATLTVRAARRECVGYHRHVYGLEFVDLDEKLTDAVRRMVEASCELCATASCWVAA